MFRNLAWLVFLIVILVAAALVWLQRGALFSSSRKTRTVRVFQQASPAVVNLTSKPLSKELDLGVFEHNFPPRAREFFQRFYGTPEKGEFNLGTGIIVDPEGYILTNEHVVINTEWIQVKLADGRTVAGEIWGSDPSLDLAVIKVDIDGPLPSLEKGSSRNIMIGEPIIVIGNPLGMGATCSQGIVSALNRRVKTAERTYKDLVQIDAAVNPGNSGGPVLNIEGELIGVTSTIAPQAEGIGFAVPIDRAWKVMEDLIEYRYIPSGWIGISVNDVGGAYEALGNDDSRGVFVSRVMDDGPASKYFNPGDIIKSWNGVAVDSVADFAGLARQAGVGSKISLERLRDGSVDEVTIKARPFPEELAEEWVRDHLGVRVEKARFRTRTGNGKIVTNEGVFVSDVVSGSPAHVVGLIPGDLILRINRMNISDLQSFRQAVSRYRSRKNILVRARRGNFSFSVTVPFSLTGERW